MQDDTLILMCNDVLASDKAGNEEFGPTTASAAEGRRIRGVIERIIPTQALTLEGIKAKASAYLALPRPCGRIA